MDAAVDAQAAPLLASPDVLTFAPIAMGKESAPQTVTIVNIGTEPVTIENITAGKAEAAFPTYGGLEGAIDAGASVDLQFAFRPQKEGPATALYHLVTDGGITSLILRLEGRGVSDQRSEAHPEKPAHDRSAGIGPIGGTAKVDDGWEDWLPWNNTTDPVTKTVVDGAKELENGEYDYGLLMGFGKGLQQAADDLGKGIVGLAKLLYRVLSGDTVGLAFDMSKTLEALLDPGLISRIEKWFVGNWTNADDYARGEFRGRVAGYITMQVVIAAVTQAAAEGIAATGVVGDILNALKGSEALEEVTTLGETVAGADQAAQTGAGVASHVPPDAPVSPDLPVPTDAGGVAPQPNEVVTQAPPEVATPPDGTEVAPQPNPKETPKVEPSGGEKVPEKSKTTEPEGPEPKAAPIRYPKAWKKFDPANNDAFRLRLRAFRGDDNLEWDLTGGEGRIFRGEGQRVALKRWIQGRLDVMPKSVGLLVDARAAVQADAELSQVIDVVEIHEQGPDWVLRDFDPDSEAIRGSGDAAADTARDRAIARLEELKSEKGLSETLEGLLKKLNKKSLNLHWSAIMNKILVIDMM